MEIKTITSPREMGAPAFDKKVNAALSEGFQLVKRGMLPAVTVSGVNYHPQYYAEMVKQNTPTPWRSSAQPVVEPDGLEVIEHLQAVAMFCAARPNCEGCSLNPFCGKHLANNEGPADWVLPEGEPDNDPA